MFWQWGRSLHPHPSPPLQLYPAVSQTPSFLLLLLLPTRDDHQVPGAPLSPWSGESDCVIQSIQFSFIFSLILSPNHNKLLKSLEIERESPDTALMHWSVHSLALHHRLWTAGISCRFWPPVCYDVWGILMFSQHNWLVASSHCTCYLWMLWKITCITLPMCTKGGLWCLSM